MSDLQPFDDIVRPDDARPHGRPDECFYCGHAIGEQHKTDCVIAGMRFLEAQIPGEFHPIDTYVDGHFVLLWFPKGERGVGGMETAMSFRDDDGQLRTGWTHGGPNSGSDFEFCEPPTLWAKLPDRPA